MRDTVLKKIVFMTLILILLAATSGCETVGAMKAGEIKMEDFVLMAKATLPGPRGGTGSQGICGLDVSGFDAWFQNNLW